jgi:hypothetical protein
VNNVENLLVKFDSFVWSDVLLTVHIRPNACRRRRPYGSDRMRSAFAAGDRLYATVVDLEL